MQPHGLAAPCGWFCFPAQCSESASSKACSQVVFLDLRGIWGETRAGGKGQRVSSESELKMLGEIRVIQSDCQLTEDWRRKKKSQWCLTRDFVAPVPVYIHQDGEKTVPTTLRVLISWKCSALLPFVWLRCHPMLQGSS